MKISLAAINTEAEIKGGVERVGAQSFHRNKEKDKIQEIDLGILYILRKTSKASLRFYIGGGITSISATQNTDGLAEGAIESVDPTLIDKILSRIGVPRNIIPPGTRVSNLPTELSGSGSGDGYFFNIGIKHLLKNSFTIGLDLRDSNSNFKITGKSFTTTKGVKVTDANGGDLSSKLTIPDDISARLDYESPEKNFGFTRLMFALDYNF